MFTRIFYYTAIIILILSNAINCSAQNRTPILERTVTVKATSQPLDKVLDIISETAGFTFSYSNEVVNTRKQVSLMAENRTVRQILDELFKGEISYQQIGNHLVLQRVIKTRSTPVNPAVKTKHDFLINGYIRDTYSGNGVNNVSIYHEKLLYSSLSGDFGYYTLKFSSPETNHPVRFSREGYRDTTVLFSFSHSGPSEYNIALRPVSIPVPVDSTFIIPDDSTSVPAVLPSVPADTTSKKTPLIKVNLNPVIGWFTTTKQRIQARNIHDTLNRKSQVTLFPPLGTNRGLSSVVNNDISFNIIAGYNGGVNKFELGGFANVVRNDVKGVQFAGFTNIVGRHTTGAQFAGFTNINGGNTSGAQFAGFLNVNNGDMYGTQFAGFANVNGGKTTGAQFAGFTNVAKQVNGLQAAGFINVAGPRSSVTQFAGFANVAGGKVNGVQAAGFINVADTVKGVQIGFINVARHSSGISLGFISFIKNGYHQLEVGLSELEYGSVAYRSGTRQFYTILHAGTRPGSLFGSGNISEWYFGYGAGTAVKLSSKFDLCLDLGWQHMNRGSYTDYTNELIKFSPTVSYQPVKGLSVFAGPSLNLFISDTANPDYDSHYANIRNNYLVNTTDMGYAYKGWIGFNAGLRFF